MYKALLLLTTCVAPAVVARSSPNSWLVEQRFQSYQGQSYPDTVLEDAVLDVPGLVAKYGYPVEVHRVVTADGYILEMHRIPHGRDTYNNPKDKRPAVLVMHGLLSSSADFLTLGPRSALGYQLAEAGYDVWFGNARGNYYSRHHLTLDPDRGNSFWRFSWDEIGNFDLPAFVDHILKTTGQRKIHYVGHSQGGTSFLVLNSLRPEYNKKFISFHGLAPASYFTYNILFRFLRSTVFENAVTAMCINEVSGNSKLAELLLDMFCGKNLSILGCLNIYNKNNIIADLRYLNATMLPVILGHCPAGASARQLVHYSQVVRFNAFRRFYYNVRTNRRTYGKIYPPTYNLSKVTVPTWLYYGMSDSLVHYRDVYKLAGVLPNVISMKRMSRDSFNHFDFIWAIDATELLYNDIIKNMKYAEKIYL